MVPTPTIELLAPARDADIGIEAVNHGADAVYIGGPAFGARDKAPNALPDLERLVRGFKLMRTILSQRALADHGARELQASASATTDEQIEAFVRAHADTIYHPVGSCRMGTGPLDVVDAQLRVHGMQGLRVVDASIMPRIVGGNTNAPTIMIAEKAADMILGNPALPPADVPVFIHPEWSTRQR